jgi:signal peptidase I
VNPAREALEWIISIVIAVAAALAIHTYVGQLVRIEGDYMVPTLINAERVVVTKYSYWLSEPQRGDIVVTHYPIDNQYYVKRIIGLPGETVEVRNGTVYINGVALAESYIAEPIEADFEPMTVEDGHVFVMGDNRNYSLDSRNPQIGTLPQEDIMGKVRAVVWPFDKFGGIGRYQGVLSAQEVSQ